MLNTEPYLQVGILSNPAIRFELHGDFVLENSGARLTGVCTATVGNEGMVLERGGSLPQSSGEFSFIPVDVVNSSITIFDVVIGVGFHWERIENQKFCGGLKIIRDGNNLIAVNTVPIEQYLTSVISSEMSASSSAQLLKAHAVTSRSWLLAQLEKSKRLKSEEVQYLSHVENDHERVRWYDREDHEFFDVCADDHCQRYQGMTKAFSPSVEMCIGETRGLTLLYDNEICDARFSKACGGISEPFENVWEPKHFPYLVPVADFPDAKVDSLPNLAIEANATDWILTEPKAFCCTHDKAVLSQVLLDYDQETTDFFRWKVEYSQAEVSEIIRSRSGIEFGEIIDLIPIERGPSGRIIRLTIVGRKKTMIIGKELEIRKTLSRSHLYSSAFVVERVMGANELPEKFIIRGAGWGHGVGLCQIGAAVMGVRGYSFEEILRHYFAHAELKKLY